MDGISVQNSDQKAKLGQLKGHGLADRKSFKASCVNRKLFFIYSHPSCWMLERENGHIDHAFFQVLWMDVFEEVHLL